MHSTLCARASAAPLQNSLVSSRRNVLSPVACAVNRRRGLWCPPALQAPTSRSRTFATAAFTVKAGAGASQEQILFVVGLNDRKFFGQDSAEEALNLLEKVQQHDKSFQLLFGLSEKQLSDVEEEHRIKAGARLTSSRELENNQHGETVPVVQAGMVDNRPRRALGRAKKVTDSHVAWELWRNPREACKMYWLFWKRGRYKDVTAQKFWSSRCPVAAAAYFDERAEVVAIRAIEHLITERTCGNDDAWTTVLTVDSDIFDLTTERIRSLLADGSPDRLMDADFSQALQERNAELCREVPDLTPLLLFIYIGLPLIFLQTGKFVFDNWTAATETVMPWSEVDPENRD